VTDHAGGARRRSAYRHAGVDVDAGDRAVELMRGHVDSTRRPEVVGGLGSLSGAFLASVLIGVLQAFGIVEGGNRFMALFASHPPIEERIAALQAPRG